MASEYDPLPDALAAHKPATEFTIAKQKEIASQLNFSDRQSFEDASRGLISTLSPMTIYHDRMPDRPAFDLSKMQFLEDEAPDTVNPSLWRQAQLNAQHHGLYEVVDGIYQIRSFDIANVCKDVRV